jgi:dipeptidyl aminopeptidase/acylaminoacyl peptidase
MMRRVTVFAVLIVMLVGADARPEQSRGAADKRPITDLDLFRFTWIADPQISPDGSQIAFVRVVANKKDEAYETSLWVVPASGGSPRRLTGGTRDTAPRWSPDGRQLAFLRSVDPGGGGASPRKEDGRPQPSQIHLMPTDGGEARAVTSLARGAGVPVWSPDAKHIAFTSTTSPDDEKKGEKEKSEEQRKSDVRVISRATYRANGGGYLDPTRPTHIWVLDVSAGQGFSAAESPPPKQITRGEFEETDPQWSPDGSRIYLTSNRVAEPYYLPLDRDLYSVPATGGEISKVASIDGVIGAYALSRDGARITFIGTLHGKPMRSYNQPDLFVAGKGGEPPVNLTVGYDHDIGGGLAGDQRAPRGGQSPRPIWSADGSSVSVIAAANGRANLIRLDVASKRVESLTHGDQEVMAASATKDLLRVVLLVSTTTNIGDLFLLEAGPNKARPTGDVARAEAGVGPRRGEMSGPRRLTDMNAELFDELTLAPPEEIWYPSFDGRKIHALVQKPVDFDPSKKYPLILNIHGGPHAAYGHTFFHEIQWMAAKGYVVLYPNPRGSSSFGQDFGNIIQYRYPGDDYNDLMAGVDELIRRGYIDPERLGVTGGSGSGLLTNWVITQTNRFAAAVSQRSIADWAGFWYTADFTLFTPTWFRGAPWEQPADFAARSPITHVKNVTTPLMLIEGEIDYRTPPSDGGEQMFRALKYLKKPTVMVQFPGESHELSRSGKPWHRVERLQHILNWFDKYLQHKDVEGYEPTKP